MIFVMKRKIERVHFEEFFGLSLTFVTKLKKAVNRHKKTGAVDEQV